MRAITADHRLDDRIEVVVDPDSDPVDWDQALAVFLLRYARSQAARSAGTAAVEVDPERQ